MFFALNAKKRLNWDIMNMTNYEMYFESPESLWGIEWERSFIGETRETYRLTSYLGDIEEFEFESKEEFIEWLNQEAS